MARNEKPIQLAAGLAKQLASSTMGYIGVDEAGRGCLAGPVCAGAVYAPHNFDFSILSGLTDSKKISVKKREQLEAEIKTACAKGGLRWGIGLAWAPEIDQVNILNATFRAMSRAVFCLHEIFAGQVLEQSKVLGVKASMELGQAPKSANTLSVQALEPVLPLFIDGPYTIPLPQWNAAHEKLFIKQQGNTSNFKPVFKQHENTAPHELFLPLPRQFPVIKGDALVPAISAASILAKVHRDRLMNLLDRRYPAYGFAHHKGYGTKEHMAALDAYGVCKQHRLSFGAKLEEKQFSFFSSNFLTISV